MTHIVTEHCADFCPICNNPDREKPTVEKTPNEIEAAAKAASDKLDRAGYYDEATLIIQLLHLAPLRPVDMLLFCPRCCKQHIDRPDPSKGWDNPAHRSHLCAGCGHIWRQCDIPTNGVAQLVTEGKDDSPAIPSIGELYLVVMCDRHVDDQYAIRSTLQDAEEVSGEFIEGYGSRYDWQLREYAGFEQCFVTDCDDGPRVYIKKLEVR